MMSLQFTIVISLFALIMGDVLLPDNNSGLKRRVSRGVKSNGYKIKYSDSTSDALNEAVIDFEKRHEKLEVNVNRALPPLQPQDVKCLMSDDKFCSLRMFGIKQILISAVKDECIMCTKEDKIVAGNVMAAIMAHDPVAWKYFLARFVDHTLTPNDQLKEKASLMDDVKTSKLEIIDNHIIRRTRNTYLMPGVTVKIQGISRQSSKDA